MNIPRLGLVLACFLCACSHVALSGAELDRASKPAFISRIEEGAGPRAVVFRNDGVFRDKLKKLDPKEADRRLQVKLMQGIHRFEVSERLRAGTYARLPRERPWTNVVSAAAVASALESFLVEEVPANPPDYELLKPLGADSVVEFVIEEFGMKSDNGKAGAYARGYGRMFFIDGARVWRKSFDVDQVRDGTASLDPFQVGKDPELYRDALNRLLDAVAEDFAHELQPAGRRGGSSLKNGSDELNTPPDDTNRTGRENEGSDELPAPDGTPPSGSSKSQKSKRDEDRGATAPGLQTPSQIPFEEPPRKDK